MKKLIFTYLFIFGLSSLFAQKSDIDSLKYQLSIVKQDTSRALILAELSYLYRNSNIDTSFIYAQKALDLAQKIRFAKAEIRALNGFGFYYRVKGDLPKALNYQNTALKIAESSGDLYEIGFTCYLIGIIYLDFRDYNKAIENYINKALKIFERLGNKERQMAVLLNLSVGYLSSFPRPQPFLNRVPLGLTIFAEVSCP